MRALALNTYRPFQCTRSIVEKIADHSKIRIHNCSGFLATIVKVVFFVALLFPVVIFDLIYTPISSIYQHCCRRKIHPLPRQDPPAPNQPLAAVRLEPVPFARQPRFHFPVAQRPYFAQQNFLDIPPALQIPPLPQFPLRAQAPPFLIRNPLRNQEGDQADVELQIPDMPEAPEIEQILNEEIPADLPLDQMEDLFPAMNPRAFCRLLDERPERRDEYIEMMIKWAEQRPIAIDPQHPYFEIFQELIQNNEKYAGAGESKDYRDYQVPAYYSGSDGREYYSQVSKFLYTIYSLMGFQELSRPDVRELLRKLDNGANNFAANPAYRFARVLIKIFVYPTRPDYPRVDGAAMDIPDKIHQCMHVPWRAYQLARMFHDVSGFFEKSFGLWGNEHCFDARIGSFQKYMEPFYMGNSDFTPDIRTTSTLDFRVMEHLRVCRNIQLMKYATERHLNYKEIKHWVDSQGTRIEPGTVATDLEGHRISDAEIAQINQQLAEFFNQYFRVQEFDEYLRKLVVPLKAMVRGEDGVDRPEGQPILRASQDGIDGWQAVLERNNLWPDTWTN